MFRTQCLTCQSGDLEEILDLGMHPFADRFIAPARASEADLLYPLICDMCRRCGQIQLRAVTDPVHRYVETEYSYTSSNSATSRAHWRDYARAVTATAATPPNAGVVEVGSNDGYLTAELKTLGFDAIGVDPSPAMAAMAADRGVQTVCELFGESSARAIRETLRVEPHLIIANNVFNHANDPADFVRGVRLLLHRDGAFVFELPYWLRGVAQGKFDQVYHEHVTYFTVTYAQELFRRHGMHVDHVEEVDYHGGSIRVYVRHGTEGGGSDTSFIKQEAQAGLFDPETYRRFSTEMRARRDRFLEKLYRLRGAGASIVCVGAAAKGNTFLNYYNLDASVIDCVTDASPTKQGKLTPRTRIPIRGDDVLRQYDNVYAVLLSWNISGALRDILLQINPRIIFLDPYDA
jgi:SAM-dependent methyltransferase